MPEKVRCGPGYSIPDLWPGGEEVARDHRVPENWPWLRGPTEFAPGQEPGAEDKICQSKQIICRFLGAPKPTLICGRAPDTNFKVAEVNGLPQGLGEVHDIIRMLRYRK